MKLEKLLCYMFLLPFFWPSNRAQSAIDFNFKSVEATDQ